MAFAFTRLSWGSIFAGAFSAMGVWIVMFLLGLALGFKVFKPKSEHPLSGLALTFSGWSCFSLVISMAAGGFMAGLSAGHHGFEHGFVVWALVLWVSMTFWALAMASTARMAGSALKSLGSGAAGAVSFVGKGAMGAAGHVFSDLRDNVRLDVDTDKLSDEIMDILRDTGVETLQPEYLRQQMREARSDLRELVHQLSMNPSDMEKSLAQFADKEKERLEALTRDIDREAAVQALMGHRALTRDNAERMVDDAVSAYGHVVRKAQESLHEARVQADDVRRHITELSDRAREKADELSSTAARGALAAAVALILAAFISMGAAWCGAHCGASCKSPIPHTYIRR
ncbi:MAG: hypothetical protein J1E80_02535 [Desulfovibrionaceae bacterium]|nr:hypothetical protein [Desulfovibrionaceae bacterium]